MPRHLALKSQSDTQSQLALKPHVCSKNMLFTLKAPNMIPKQPWRAPSACVLNAYFNNTRFLFVSVASGRREVPGEGGKGDRVNPIPGEVLTLRPRVDGFGDHCTRLRLMPIDPPPTQLFQFFYAWLLLPAYARNACFCKTCMIF